MQDTVGNMAWSQWRLWHANSAQDMDVRDLVTSVPEPSTWATACAGLTLLAARRWRTERMSAPFAGLVRATVSRFALPAQDR